MKINSRLSSVRASSASGFSLIELLVAIAITTVVMGSTLAALMEANQANQMATMMTAMNSNLRTGMDLMVRDLLQTGQSMPVGRVVWIPSGPSATQIKLPGPPGSTITVASGTTELSAVLPRPGAGPAVNGPATDMITFLAGDSSFSNVDLTAVASNTVTVAMPASGITGANITNGGPDDVHPGELIMLTKGSASTLVQVTRVVGQVVYFESGDSLGLNQTAAEDGTLPALNATAPVNSAVDTQATRIRMISYYIDATTTPGRPRLVRRMNNGSATTYDNDLGTAVSFDVENLQISYDLANGSTNPANIKMTSTDMSVSGPCSPNECSPNQIRKVNIVLSGRSNQSFQLTRDFLRNSIAGQVSLRSLSFVDKYTNVS
jgi:prepilin-type N-terminal cleavage/methylation domain-containing protein